MASATVGTLRAVLLADTAQFDAPIAKSTGKIEDLSKETTRAAQNLAKMLGGDALVKKAGDIQQALGLLAVRGIKPTADEAAKLEPTVAKAIAKLESMGKAVDPSLRQTQAALKGVADQGSKTGLSLDKLAGFGKSALGLFGIGVGVGSAVSFVSGVFDAADAIGDLSLKMGVSVEAAQRFRFAARQSGAEIEDVSKAIVTMNNHLASGEASTFAALKAAGLSFGEIRRMEPEKAFRAIADAIALMPDPMEQTRVAMDLFGKSGAELLPMIREASLKTADGIQVMTDDTIKALKDAKQNWQNFWDSIVIMSGNALGTVAKGFTQDLKDKIERQKFETIVNSPGMQKYATAEDVARLNRESLDTVLSVGKVKGAYDGLAPSISMADDVLKEFNKTFGTADAQMKRAEGAIKAAADVARLEEAYQKFKREQLQGVTDEFKRQIDFEIRYAKETGNAVGALAKRADAVDLLTNSLKKLNLLPPPPSSVLDHLKAFIGVPGPSYSSDDLGLANLPASRFNAERAAAASRQFAYWTDIASRALGELGRTGSQTWRDVSQGLVGAVGMMQDYNQAMAQAATITDETQKANAQNAAAMQQTASGYMFILGIVMNMIQASDAYNARMATMASTFQQLHQTYSGRFGGNLSANVQEAYQLENDARRLGIIAHISGESTAQSAARILQEISDRTVASIQKMQDALAEFGGHAPASLRPYLDSLIQSGRLTQQQIDLLKGMEKGLTSSQALDIAKEIGLPESGLGIGYEQLKVNELAKKYFGDFTQLSDIGANRNDLLKSLADEIQDLLINHPGTSIPAFLKPIMQEMIGLKLINNKEGNPLTDLLGVQFNDLKSPIDEAVDWLAKIYDVLGIGFGLFGLTPPPPGDQHTLAMPSLDTNGGWSVVDTSQPVHGSGGGDTYNINTLDPRGFEQFLKDGGNRAVMRTLPEAVRNASLGR